jgi:ABC-2 type transport system permease protein
VSLRFVFPAVSLEGMPFWAVRSAPVSLKRLYWYKFGFTIAVIFVLAELLAVPSTALLRDNPFLVALFAICMGFVALALTSVNLGAGTYFASYREKNPIRIASSQGASLTFLLAMIYLAVVVGVLVLPLNMYFERELMQGVPTASWIAAPVIIVGLLSLTLSVVSTSVGMKSLTRDF